MKHLSKSSARSVLFAGLAVAFLVACGISVSFDMNQDVVVDAVGNNVSTVKSFDLAKVQAVQDNKSKLDKIALDSITLSVTAVGAANKATTLTGTVKVRADGAPPDGSQDILVGTVTGLSIKVGTTLTIQGNSAIDTFLTNTVKGSGKFGVSVSGATDGEAHGTIHAVIHATLTANTGL
jgi:hypothetical protein